MEEFFGLQTGIAPENLASQGLHSEGQSPSENEDSGPRGQSVESKWGRVVDLLGKGKRMLLDIGFGLGDMALALCKAGSPTATSAMVEANRDGVVRQMQLFSTAFFGVFTGVDESVIIFVDGGCQGNV